MSWKLGAAAALVAAGLLVASPAHAGHFGMAWHGGHGYGGHGYYHRGFYGAPIYGYAYRNYYPRYYSYYPRFGFGFGLSYYQPYLYAAPPVYYVPPPVYYYSAPAYGPVGVNVETYSLPDGAATYSVTRPKAGAETLPYPVPKSGYPMPPARDGTFPYDGGPADPVPLPAADLEPATTPRFHLRPAETVPVSWSDETKLKAKEPAKGQFAYPAYGEEPRRTDFAADRTIKKDGR